MFVDMWYKSSWCTYHETRTSYWQLRQVTVNYGKSKAQQNIDKYMKSLVVKLWQITFLQGEGVAPDCRLGAGAGPTSRRR